MAYIKKEISTLADFLPDGAFPLVEVYLKQHKIGLTLTKGRKSILGNYYFDSNKKIHKISVNGNLNPYQFLITLIHELAHLFVFVQYQNTVMSHGKEWKQTFASMLQVFMQHKIFPEKIEQALTAHLQNVKSTHCKDPVLYKVLRSYDESPLQTVNEVGIGNIFSIDSGEQFIVIEKNRTRYKCQSLRNKKIYLFPGNYEVQF